MLAICGLYLFAWMSDYSDTTLGRFPSHANTESITQALSADSAPHFSLYDSILALLAHFFETSEGLISAARTLNLAAVLVAAILVGLAAGQYWRADRSACAAALLVGCNPVVAFNVGQISSTPLAICCVALLAWRLINWLRQAKIADSFIIGGALAIGAALESSLIVPAIAWPVVALLYPVRQKATHLIAALIAPASITALLFVSNLQLQPAIEPNVTGVLAKLYSLFSNQEISDGTSYALHGKLSLFLLINPIHWGLIIILAGGGFYARTRDPQKRRGVYAFLLFSILFAVGFILSDGGGQNRLAALPLLVIIAAGSISKVPKIWRRAEFSTHRRITIGAACLALLTYSGAFVTTLSDTDKEQDYAFMAEASIALGENNTAVTWAQKVLEMNNESKAMHSIMVRADFNNWALISQPRPLSSEAIKELLTAIEAANLSDPIVRSIKGFYLWKLKDQDAARALWKTTQSDSALSQIGLLWTGGNDIEPTAKSDPYFELAQIARQTDRASLAYGGKERLIDNLFAEGY